MLTVLSISFTFAAMGAPVTTKTGSKLLDVAWGASRALTSGEIELAKTIYDGNVDYLKSGVNYGKWWSLQQQGREMTPKGIIFTGNITIPDYSQPGGLGAREFLAQKSTFIHEMCHVWQYQHGVNVVLNGLDRNYHYFGPNFGNLKFSEYGIEQQAQMTSDYYLLLNNGGDLSDTVPTPAPSLTTYEKVIPFLPK